MSFNREYDVKAVRKSRRCDVCRAPIEIGFPAIRWVGMIDDEFGTLIFHPDCRGAEIAYNRMTNCNWDEWYSLASDLEPDDHAWLLDEWPAVAARMGIANPTSNIDQVAG